MKLNLLTLAIVFILTFACSAYSLPIKFEKNIEISKTEKLKIKFLGNTSIYIQDLGKEKKSIFIDAFVSRPRWDNLFFDKISHKATTEIEEVLIAAKIKTIGTIVPLHSHFDHLLDAPYIAKKHNSKLVASKTTELISKSMGFKLDILKQTFEDKPSDCNKTDKKCNYTKNIETNEIGTNDIGTFSLTVEKSMHSNTKPFGHFVAPLNKPPYEKDLKNTFKKHQRARKYIEGQSVNVHIYHSPSKTSIYVLGGIPLEYCHSNKLPKNLLDANLVFIAVPVIRELKKPEKLNCIAGFEGKASFWRKLNISSKTVVPVHWDSLGTKLNKVACDEDIRKCLKRFFPLIPTMSNINNDLVEYKMLKLRWLTAFGEIKI